MNNVLFTWGVHLAFFVITVESYKLETLSMM